MLRAVAPGSQIDRTIFGYRVHRLLRVTKGGTYYHVRHHALDRAGVLKLLECDPTRRPQLRREATTLARLSHPNVAALVHFGEDEDGRLVLLLEDLPGVTLAQALSGGPPPIAETKTIVRQLALALAELHSLGLSRAELRPDHVMLVQGPLGVVAKLYDLARVDEGLERTIPAHVGAEDSLDDHPQYRAPELSRPSAHSDELTDLYALGVILYQCLSGRLPFDGPADFVRGAQTWCAAPPLTSTSPLSSLAHALLQRDPSARPPSAMDVVRLIDSIELDAVRAETPASTSALRRMLPSALVTQPLLGHETPRMSKPLWPRETSSAAPQDLGAARQPSIAWRLGRAVRYATRQGRARSATPRAARDVSEGTQDGGSAEPPLERLSVLWPAALVASALAVAIVGITSWLDRAR